MKPVPDPVAAAAAWQARRNGGFSAADEFAFAQWLEADPAHRQAWEETEATWALLNAPRETGAADAVWAELAARRRDRRRRRFAVFSALGAAAVLVLWAGPRLLPERSSVPLAAAAARPTIRTLADGSKIALRPGAEIAVDFQPGRRGVRLLRGEALFTVAKDATRPFVVATGDVDVRAVGTEFLVRGDAETVTVIVTEGRIAVGRGADELLAGAGERVVVPRRERPAPARVDAVAAPDLAAALAWRGERLEFSDTPLAEALAAVNRRAAVPLALADPALGQRRITGVLWADDSEGFVRLLEAGFDLVAERDGAGLRLRERRR